MVSSPTLFMPEDMKVGELINKEEASWKTDAVDALFLPFESEAIKAIPISSNLPEDKLIWAWSTNGFFFSKKCILDSISDVDTCDGCSEEAESSIHFFWKCSRTKELWSSSKLVFPSVMDQLHSFKELLWCLMMDEKISPENIELLLTCAWAVWGNRNDVHHGGKRKDGRTLIQWAVQYLEKYRATVELLPNAQESNQLVQRWIPPPILVFKFNVDGATGQSVAAIRRKLHAPLGLLEVEAKVVEVGLQFAKQLGITDFIIEGDSLIVSKALNQSSSVPMSIDAVIMGIGEASLEFHNVVFSHVKRNANTFAHLLAKYAKGTDHQCMWLENCSNFLELAVLHNVNTIVV
ncbi:uncharacterized protein LOC142628749 [Castanea sativa]|uniref:uncharacterized protein LOC142628749 n=1 Tax=Castanea sativa TaxID=21020 RepID=UPI003F64C0AD